MRGGDPLRGSLVVPGARSMPAGHRPPQRATPGMSLSSHPTVPLPSVAERPMPSPLAHAERLTALRATGLLDGSASPVLDRIARLAARLLEAPVALVALVEPGRQSYPGAFGTDRRCAASERGSAIE